MENQNCNCGSNCRCGRRFGLKFVLILFGMLLLTGVIGLSIIRDRIVNWPNYQVSVVGQGKISYQPDVANVTLGVQIDKTPKAEDALNQLNDRMNKIVAAVKALGVEEADIKTQNYSLLPQYDYIEGVSTSSGFSANEQLVIKVKNMKEETSKLSRIVEEASKAGANQVLGISYDVSNLEELKQQARLAAITDARGKADEVAKTAGVELGEVVGWWENLMQAPNYSYMYGYYGNDKGGMGAGASPTVPAGTQEIIIEVNVSYKLK